MHLPRLLLSLAALLLASLAFADTAAAPPPDWTFAFTDDFERDTIGMDWELTRGDWRIENGRLVVTRLEGWSSDSVIRLARPLRGDVRLSFELTVPGASSVKAAVKIGEQYWGGGGPDRVGELALTTARGSATDTTPLLEVGRTHRVVIEHAAGVLRGWLDGALLKQETLVLDDCPHNDGIALVCFTNAAFDNVQVHTRPQAAAERWARVSVADNRRATVHAQAHLDPALPCGGLQKAIDALPATGGVVIIPEGRFVMHQPLFPRPGVALRGQGRKTVLTMASPMIFTRLSVPAERGATEIIVEDASRFRPGMVLTAGGTHYSFHESDFHRVEQVTGTTVRLNRPLTGTWAKGQLVGNWFPMIWAQDTSEIDLRDLTIDGQATDPAPFAGGYGTCAVSLFRVRDWRMANVHVLGWKADGLSVQGGRNALWTDCLVANASGHGYHPGSLQRHLIMTRLVAEDCGGDGFFWCRYNQESVANHNRFARNKGAMFGGLAGAGDRYNTITHNLGVDNAQGMHFAGGANNVFMNNVVAGQPGEPVALNSLVPITGGTYEGLRPHHVYIYSGPTRNMVVVDNTFIDTRERAEPVAAITAAPGAGSNVVAGNRYHVASLAEPAVAVPGPHNVAWDNTPAATAVWTVPEALPGLPEPPAPILDGAAFHDADAPDQGFQRALDELAARGGGTLRLPGGRFELRTPLRLPSKVTLLGEGVATVLMARDPDQPAIVASDAEDIAVRRLWLVGGGPGETAPGEDAVALVDIQRGTRVLLAELDMRETAGAGARLRDCDDIRLRMNRLWRVGVGLVIEGGANLVMAENQVLHSQSDGIAITRVGGGIRLGSNIVHHSHRHALALVAPGAPGAVIDGNVFSFIGQDGVRLERTRAAAFTGNVILNASLAARGRHAHLLLDSARDTNVRGNRMGDETYDTIVGAAVREHGECGGNHMRFNVLCPDMKPATATLANLLDLHAPDARAEHNVLMPYPMQ